jgi:signal transduction histidine kinase
MAKFEDGRILIVHDDPNLCRKLKAVLSLDGFEVDIASSENEARSLNWLSYFAIIMGRQPADIASNQWLAEIKSKSPNTATIVIADCASWRASRKALLNGVEDDVFKPVNFDELRTSLAEIVRTRQAQRRGDELERLAVIGRMMAGFAHESRNAIQRIQTGVDMLRLDVSDPDLIGQIEAIERAGHDLKTMLEEIRDFSAPLKLELHEVNLSSVWRRAWSNVVSVGNHSDAKFVDNTDGCDLNCSVDDFRLEQVFRNIFENSLAACQTTPSIQIDCLELNGTSSGTCEPEIKIAIRDNGPGIEKEQAQRIFEPFFTTKQTGTGLGMAIVKRSVEAHGGSVAIGTGDASGAEVIIAMPRRI